MKRSVGNRDRFSVDDKISVVTKAQVLPRHGNTIAPWGKR